MSVNRAPNRPVVAPKFHHTTFTTMRLQEMIDWYEKVAGLTPVFYGDVGAWLTNDEANHRIAFLSPPGLKAPVDKPHTVGLHHTAFEYKNFDQWLDNYVRLRDHGIVPFMNLDHGMTVSMYYADPDGNGVEIQVDAFGDWDSSKSYMFSSLEFASDQLGAFFDPDKLVAARDQGLGFAEIHERCRAGEYAPDQLPADIFLPEVW